MPAAEAIDPFRSVSDPAEYLPRVATERALEALEKAVDTGPGAALALIGPAGIGKSLLARVLAARLGNRHTVVYPASGALPLDELAELALDALGEPETDDPVAALLDRAAELRRARRPLLWILDPADGLSPETIAGLSALFRRAAGDLSLLLIVAERVDLEVRLEPFGAHLQRISLSAPMTLEETHSYIDARLKGAGERGSLRTRLDHATVRRLHAASGGIPSALHAAIAEIQLETWRGVEVAPSAETRDPEWVEACAPLPELDPSQELSPGWAPEPEPAESSPTPAPARAALAASPSADHAETQPALATGAPRARFVSFAAGMLCGALVMGAGLQWLSGSIPRPDAGDAQTSTVAAPAAPRSEPETRPAVQLPAQTEVKPVAPRAPDPGPAARAAPPSPSVPAPETRDPDPPPVSAPPPARPPAPAPVARRAAPAEEIVQINVQAFPWATIWIDGRRIGETPLADVEVAAGTREVRAEMPDGRVLTRRVEVRRGHRLVFR